MNHGFLSVHKNNLQISFLYLSSRIVFAFNVGNSIRCFISVYFTAPVAISIPGICFRGTFHFVSWAAKLALGLSVHGRLAICHVGWDITCSLCTVKLSNFFFFLKLFVSLSHQLNQIDPSFLYLSNTRLPFDFFQSGSFVRI